ncbi:MAG: hypothetical protein ACI4VF_01915 [Lachnospirales bacterium]
MKKFLVFLVCGLMLTGCGSINDDENMESSTSTTEETTVEVFDVRKIFSEEESTEISTDDEIIHPVTKNDNNDKKENKNSDKTDEDYNPEISKPSPVENVSNEIFIDVCDAVRDNCNSGANGNGQNILSSSKSLAKTNEEKTYVNTAINLINSYTRLNDCRNRMYENNDLASDDDIALLTNIEEGLSANVEIFLNTDTTSVMDSNFAYNNELDNLELSLNNK